MRSAEAMRSLVMLAAVALLAGCSTVTDQFNSVRAAITPSPSTPAAATTAPRPAAPPPEEPVSPAAQMAFDTASRALRSGRTDDAEKQFRALAQTNPELGGPHANLGVIQALTKRQTIRCACLGTVLNVPMSTITLVEDLAMVGMAALALLGGH